MTDSTPSAMTGDLARRTEQVRLRFGDLCFACGRKNDLGLHIDDWDIDDHGVVSARFRPRPEYVGAEPTLHGGIAATALDEAMVWAGIFNEAVLTVTGTLDLRFRRTVLVSDLIDVRGWVIDRSGRRLRLGGELVVDGNVCVTASGLYIVSEPVPEFDLPR